MRLDGLTPDRLDAAQRDLYERIVAGPRSAGPQHFPLVDGSGALTGPFGIMLHAPDIGRSLQDLGAAIRYRTSLSARVREIAILSVAAATSCAFEAYAHERVGRAAGLTELELESLARGEFAGADPVEVAAYRLCELLHQDRFPVEEAEFLELRTALGESTLIELVVLVGYYRTLAQLLHLFDIGVPTGD
ncbi:carboxymuconolactone decarboxylase family protein [Streptomyces sp. NPDC001604]|uniref:carboxymuconolactone decarboxylase family protein n=1 Tax=Streptomyces sp. NPDC001604 TaxID=3364593 RepID=UPI00369B8447